MSFLHHGADAMSYAPCYYEDIGVPFRGPKRDLVGRYIACLGGTGMFGKFVPQALPDLLEAGAGLPAVNLGQLNCGVDFMSDPGILSIAQRAECTVIELVGAHNLSNRFYRVHPRRNDRLISPTPLLREVFPTLDLSEVHFTRHLLALMQATAPRRMATVVEELQHTWLERMQQLLAQLSGPVILLWMGGGPVPDRVDDPSSRVPFVDQHMVSGLSELATDMIIIDVLDPDPAVDVAKPSQKYAPQLKLLPSAQEIATAANRVLLSFSRCGLARESGAKARAV